MLYMNVPNVIMKILTLFQTTRVIVSVKNAVVFYLRRKLSNVKYANTKISSRREMKMETFFVSIVDRP